MKRLIMQEVWRYFKFLIIFVGVSVLHLLLLRDTGYIEENQFLMILPYLLIIYVLVVIAHLFYSYLIKKTHRRKHNMSIKTERKIISPLPIIAMVFTSITVLNSSMIVLGFDRPIEGPEAFVQMLLLIVLIAILVGMLLSSYLKAWYEDFEFEQLFSRFIDSGGKHFYAWSSMLFTVIIVCLGLMTLILSITLDIETGLTMHETFIKIYGAVVALGLIARFMAYRKHQEMENNKLK